MGRLQGFDVRDCLGGLHVAGTVAQAAYAAVVDLTGTVASWAMYRAVRYVNGPEPGAYGVRIAARSHEAAYVLGDFKYGHFAAAFKARRFRAQGDRYLCKVETMQLAAVQA